MSKDVLDNGFDEFVEQLTDNTQLTQRQSEVYTLRRCDYSRSDIQELLSLSEGAVDSHYSTAKETVTASGTTLARHFYTTELGDIPLLWNTQTTINLHHSNADPVRYTLCTPLSGFPNRAVSEFTRQVRVFTVSNIHPELQFEESMTPVRHITFTNTDEQDFYSVLSKFFDTPNNQQLTSGHAKLLTSLYTDYGNSLSPIAFAEKVIGEKIKSASTDFYSEIDEQFLIAVGQLTYKYTENSDGLTLAESLDETRTITLDDFGTQDWVSIVGKIGSGTNYTRELLLAQLPFIVDDTNDAKVLEFAPLDYGDSRNGYQIDIDGIYSGLESSSMDDSIQAFYDLVTETIRANEVEELYVVIDEAHYFTQDPVLFKEILELVHNSNEVTLLTTTQTFKEFVENDEFEPYISEAVWLFHKLSHTSDKGPFSVPSEVKTLTAGDDEQHSQCLIYNQDEPFVMGQVAMSMLQK